MQHRLIPHGFGSRCELSFGRCCWEFSKFPVYKTKTLKQAKYRSSMGHKSSVEHLKTWYEGLSSWLNDAVISLSISNVTFQNGLPSMDTSFAISNYYIVIILIIGHRSNLFGSLVSIYAFVKRKQLSSLLYHILFLKKATEMLRNLIWHSCIVIKSIHLGSPRRRNKTMTTAIEILRKCFLNIADMLRALTSGT